MATEYRRLLEPRVLSANLKQGYDEVFDAGAYTTLQVQGRVLQAASGGGNPGENLVLQHAEVNEADAYTDLPGISWSLTGPGDIKTVTAFLRYIRWATDNAVAGTTLPVAVIDILAKE